jgi:hypothetical protein
VGSRELTRGSLEELVSDQPLDHREAPAQSLRQAGEDVIPVHVEALGRHGAINASHLCRHALIPPHETGGERCLHLCQRHSIHGRHDWCDGLA